MLAETLLVCWRRLDDVPEEPLPWAYGVARNCLANATARRTAPGAARGPDRRRRPAAADHAGPGEGDDPDLAEALGALRAEDAELLRLWAWEQLTPAEIAAVLDITPERREHPAAPRPGEAARSWPRKTDAACRT